MLISGWLTKKGSANAFSSGNAWRRRYFMLCAPANGHGGGAVLKYFSSDATASLQSPRGETPVQPDSAVRVLDTEAALAEYGLSNKFLGKRLLVFHAAPGKGEREVSRTAGDVLKLRTFVFELFCHLRWLALALSRMPVPPLSFPASSFILFQPYTHPPPSVCATHAKPTERERYHVGYLISLVARAHRHQKSPPVPKSASLLLKKRKIFFLGGP